MKQGWDIKKLSEVCYIMMGQSPSSDTYNDSEGLPFFQGNADFGKIHPQVRVYCNAPIRVAETDDILISVRAPIGAINIADCKCCIGRGLAAIRNLDSTIGAYIYHALVANKEKLIAQGTGSTFKSIGRETLKKLSIPIPPLAEQEKIVAELDCLSGVIEKKKQQLKELDALAESIFYTMFGDPITNEKGWEVSHFKKEDNWLSLSEVDVHTLKNDIAPLLPKNTMEPTAKMFDALMLVIELGYVNDEVKTDKKIAQVQKVAGLLVEKKATLPQVQAKMATLKEVLSVVAWENVSLQWLEKVRKDLRELMQFLKGDKGKWFVVDIEDVITDDGESEGIKMRVSYKQRIIDFLASNRNLPVLKKIYNLEQLSAVDINELERILWSELGSKEDYAKYTQNMLFGGNVAAFIRSLIGVDRSEALNKFSEFLSDNTLNSEQEDFLNTIVQYVCENGDITKEIVVNEAPFDEKLVLFTPYMIPLGRYIDNIHNVIIPQGTSTGTYA